MESVKLLKQSENLEVYVPSGRCQQYPYGLTGVDYSAVLFQGMRSSRRVIL